jgi:outer membrane protein TolC
MALRDNAELKSVRARLESMRERPAQAGALSNPMLTLGAMDMVDGGDWPDAAEKRLMLEQEFPGSGKRALRRDIAAKDAEAMQYELEAMTREIVMRVKETYTELYAVQRILALARIEDEALRSLAKVVETMYAAGERAQADVLKAQAEVGMLQQRLLELGARETTLQARLNALFNRRAGEPLGAAVTSPEAGVAALVQALGETWLTDRPEVRAAQAQVERSELEQRLMAKEGAPDFRVGVEYRRQEAADDMAMVTATLDLPVWRSRVRAGVREAEQMAAANRATREAAERQAELEAHEATVGLLAALRRLERYRVELVPQAEARFRASEAGYRTGQVDFMDLLESERFRLEVKTMAAMAEGDVGMQAARLERAAGVAPEGSGATP